MKRFSKVLAVLMVITILCSVFVMPASAALNTNTFIKYRFEDLASNQITSAKAGDIVDMVIAINTSVYCLNIQATFKYDYEALTLVKQSYNKEKDPVVDATPANCVKWLGDFGSKTEIELTEADGELYEIEQNEGPGEGICYPYGIGGKQANPNAETFYPKSWTEAQKAKYRIATVMFSSSVTDWQLLVNTKGEDYDMARMRFVVKKDTPLDSSVLSYDDAFAAITYISYSESNTPFGALVPGGSAVKTNLTVETLGGSTPAPQMTIVNASTQVQWQDKATGKLRLGFRGNVQNLTPDFEDKTPGVTTGNITNIKCMGIVYSTTVENPTVKNEVKSSTVNGKTVYYCEASDGCTNVPTYTLYDFTSGGYFFRAVVGGVDKASDTKFYANAYIVLPDDTIVNATNGATETSGKAQYERAKANLEK